MSTKGRDAAVNVVAFDLAVAILLLAASVVLWRIAPSGLL
jgi:hypothetical protein